MVVFVNNQKVDISDNQSLIDVLLSVQIQNLKGIAVAVNDRVISKKDFETFRFQENDRLTVIRATQGG